MPELPFLTYDVFTDRPFGGNPLAVFPDARAIPLELLQTIAREFNLSETTFAYPVDGQPLRRRLRIFTPAAELPFAGHPTVGTAIALAECAPECGALPWPEDHSRLDILLEEAAGPVPVRIQRQPGKPLSATLIAPRLPERGPPSPDRAALARALGLPPDRLADHAEPACWAAGVRFVIVPLRDAAALGAIALDAGACHDLSDGWAQGLFATALGDGGSGGEIRARMFAPALGIAEDPATGAAAVALAGYLAERQEMPKDGGTVAWTIRQGEEMGRPSRLQLEACFEEGRLEAVRLGGEAVMVSRGTFRIP